RFRADLGSPPSAGSEPVVGPRTFRELWARVPDGRSAHGSLVHCPPLRIGGLTVLAGEGGLFAVRPAGRGPDALFDASAGAPVTGVYADVGASRPVNAPAPALDDLVLLFGRDEIFEVEPEELPHRLTHEPTRRILIDFGLPDMRDEHGMGLYPFGDHRMDVLDEVPWPDDLDPPAESGPFFQIGFWMGGELVIDGPTGHVLRIPTQPDEEHLSALPAARSLEGFLTKVAVWVTGLRSRDTIQPGSAEAVLLPWWVLSALARIEDQDGVQPAWAYALYHR
ncbi:MAG TPA: SUKH-4 family immunity protein, partial [Candidatus Limnocylindrales bacterium]